mgnify:CR=1 FL=1
MSRYLNSQWRKRSSGRSSKPKRRVSKYDDSPIKCLSKEEIKKQKKNSIKKYGILHKFEFNNECFIMSACNKDRRDKEKSW